VVIQESRSPETGCGAPARFAWLDANADSAAMARAAMAGCGMDMARFVQINAFGIHSV
jgi:hypothetical protein